MSDDYLWDGSGEPDPEIERLERLLRPLAHSGPPPRFAARRPASSLRAWAVAAAVLLALATAWLTRPSAPGWDVARLAGAPRVGGAALEQRGRWRAGQWLETDDVSRARIEVGTIGEVELEPRSRARLTDAGAAQHRLSLLRGTLHARIWAPPGRFVVDTPSATAVDLGCAYSLEVDDSGAGLLSVRSGWVGFTHEGRESFVPEGGRCATRPGVGPGTPYFADASERFRAALTRRDFESDAGALAVILAEARPRDALSLWHLLSRVGGEDRVRVYERLAAFVPPPPVVTREGILAGDAVMLDRYWNALGLDDVAWWRRWERPWTPPSAAR